MTWVAYDVTMGEVDLSIVDTSGPGPFSIGGTAGRSSQYVMTLRGWDPNLGGGEFIYAAFATTIAAGAACQLSFSLVSGRVVASATPWTGTANAGQAICIAVSAGVSGQYGWFQIQGSAIANVSGTPTANTPVYWQANGVLSGTGVASKQLEAAQFATTNGVTLGTGANAVVLPASQAVVYLQDCSSQGAIT